MFVRAKVAEREAARALRAMGMPYKRIAAELAVSVNSAYHWTRDIRLTPAQKQANLRGPNGPNHPDRARRALPKTSVRKHAINHMPTSSSGQAKNKLPYGVCTLRVNDTAMVQHIYGAIQEYGGFEEPRWLD